MSVYGSLADPIRAERQRDGIVLAQQKGTKFGRKKGGLKKQVQHVI